jgi:uncharacterized protein YqhQ
MMLKMKYLRHFARFFALTQVLPIIENGELGEVTPPGEEILVGGQAVLEGVMMRSPHAWGIAVRKPSGEMVTHSEPLERPSEKHKWMAWPVVRGIMTLGYAMQLGYKAMRYSTNVALAEAQPEVAEGEKLQISGWLSTLNTVLSIAFFIAFYKFLPLLVAHGIQRHEHFGTVALNFVDGGIRLLLFLGFLWLLSRMKDIRRIFEFHGAEHKTVFAFEANRGDSTPITISRAQEFVTWHPRCGTSFLMTVMLISLCVYALFPAKHFATQFAIRLALLPLIVGVSYELIRFAGKLRNQGKDGGLFHLLTLPGLWLQRITTQPPADDQVEIAIVALDSAMDLEKQRGGELVLA